MKADIFISPASANKKEQFGVEVVDHKVYGSAEDLVVKVTLQINPKEKRQKIENASKDAVLTWAKLFCPSGTTVRKAAGTRLGKKTATFYYQVVY